MLLSKINCVKEWKDYAGAHGLFTLDDSWGNAPLAIRDGEKRLGISVQERSWGSLLEGVTREGIVNDLIDTFAELRIGEFYMEKAIENAKPIVVTRGLAGIGDAWIVLSAVCNWLGVRKMEQDFQGQKTDSGGSELWVYCKLPDGRGTPSENHKRLLQVTGAKGWDSAAIGYLSDPDGSIRRSV
jgi:hypothetical protein